jgi:hypothetical protein
MVAPSSLETLKEEGMRRIWIFLLAAMLASATPALAAGEGKGEPAAKKDGTTTAATTAAAKGAAKNAEPVKPGNAAVSAELDRLQSLIQQQAKELEAQRKQLEALQHQMNARSTGAGTEAGNPAMAAPSPALTAEAATPKTTEAAKAEPASQGPAVIGHHGGAAAESSSQAAEKKPSAIELAGGRIQLGFTMYGDWGMYYNTGFGPQFFTQINQPGPGNDNFNSFDINRTYINFRYTPTSGAYTIRFTPNIYRQLAHETAVANSSVSAVGASGNGNLTLRMKYAYIEFNHPFAGSEAFGKDKITIGQQTNPMIDWEEAFYGYRFTSLVPWNYLSLSSTHAGISVHGPIMSGGKQYLDYAVGVFNSGSFHNQEQAAEKQVMARVSFYPMGATSKFGGLGFTGFVDYGYANAAPDMPNHSLYRTAFLGHYWSKHFAIAGEYDYGKNAFSKGNLFSGSGPLDAFGLGTTQYAGLNSIAGSILSLGSQQRGFDFLGHVDIPNSPFSIFGLYEYFQPNVNVGNNPLDFQRVVAGIAYKYDAHLRFALDSQNLIYTHSQFTFNGIPNAVPNNTNALFANVELNF